MDRGLKAWVLLLATNAASCFPWKDGLLYFFLGKCLPATEVWKTIFYLLFSLPESETDVPLKEQLAKQLNNHAVLFLKKTVIPACAEVPSVCAAHFVTQSITMKCAWELKLHQPFLLLIKGILK